MKQEVNLSLAQKEPEKSFTAASMVKLCIIYNIVLMLIYGLVVWKRNQMEDELQKLEFKRMQTSSQLSKAISKKEDTRTKDELMKLIVKYNREKATQDEMLTEIESKIETIKIGFSHYLIAMKESAVENLRISESNINNDTGDILITGQAKYAELIPQYLEKLGETDVFSGKEFQEFNIKRIGGETDNVIFSVSATTQEDE